MRVLRWRCRVSQGCLSSSSVRLQSSAPAAAAAPGTMSLRNLLLDLKEMDGKGVSKRASMRQGSSPSASFDSKAPNQGTAGEPSSPDTSSIPMQPLQCSQCQKPFRSPVALEAHQAERHSAAFEQGLAEQQARRAAAAIAASQKEMDSRTAFSMLRPAELLVRLGEQRNAVNQLKAKLEAVKQEKDRLNQLKSANWGWPVTEEAKEVQVPGFPVFNPPPKVLAKAATANEASTRFATTPTVGSTAVLQLSGTVLGVVAFGAIGAEAQRKALCFTLVTKQYHCGNLLRLSMTKSYFTVRCLDSLAHLEVKQGDNLMITAQLGTHMSYDQTTRRYYENVVLDVHPQFGGSVRRLPGEPMVQPVAVTTPQPSKPPL